MNPYVPCVAKSTVIHGTCWKEGGLIIIILNGRCEVRVLNQPTRRGTVKYIGKKTTMHLCGLWTNKEGIETHIYKRGTILYSLLILFK